MPIVIHDVKNPWNRACFDGAKTHTVHSSLLPPLIADLEAREFAFDGLLPVSGWMIDRPGMIISTRPVESISLQDGFTLRIPCEDWDYYTEVFIQAEVRKFVSGEKYYKFHSWLGCFVVSETEKEYIQEELLRRYDDVLARDEAFHEEYLEWLDKRKKEE